MRNPLARHSARLPARPFAAALAALITLLAACAVNPVTGKNEVSFMSSAQEAEIGRQEAAKVAQQIGLVDDPAMAAYVRTLGQRLAARSPRKDVTYQFFIADMPEPNAFALPGGYIYVSRGLLTLANSEQELANVIGHEIGHVAARHAAQRDARATGVGLATMVGTVLAGIAGGGNAARAAAQLGQAAGAGLIASYGRDQERQADEIGQTLAAGSGWSPLGMSTFLATLEKQQALQKGGTPRPSYLDSHPALGERVQVNATRAATLTVTPSPPVLASQGDFYRRFEGVLIGTDPAGGIFREQSFLHPGLGIRIDFPTGWATQNTPTAVLAGPPGKDALLRLEAQPGATDPQTAGEKFARATNLTLQGAGGTRVGGYPAFHAVAEATSNNDRLGVDLTWIAHPSGMLRVAGLTSVDRFRNFTKDFRTTAGSLRDLSAEDRRAITELRLQVVQGRAGETLAALGERTNNRWPTADTAVANELPAGEPLRAARPVKIAVAKPYVPKPARAP